MKPEYIYVSYADIDRARVLPIIDYMNKCGINTFCVETFFNGEKVMESDQKMFCPDKSVCFVSDGYCCCLLLNNMAPLKKDVLIVYLDDLFEFDEDWVNKKIPSVKSVYRNEFYSEKYFSAVLCGDDFFDGFRDDNKFTDVFGKRAALSGFDEDEYYRNASDTEYMDGRRELRKGNYKKAVEIFSALYKKGNFLAGMRIAELNITGYYPETSVETAYNIFTQVAEKNNDPLARAWFAKFKYNNNAQEARTLMQRCLADLEKKCICGSAEAKFFLGCEYKSGRLVDKDDEKAFRLLVDAYEGGCLQAGAQLAECYRSGIGCRKDVLRAVDILTECAQAKEPFAIYKLGLMYFDSEGVAEDLAYAYKLLKAAAEAGFTGAMELIGDYYFYDYLGKGISAEDAIIWYEKAEKQGSVYAAEKLGLIYSDKDKDKAFKYFVISADKGSEFSQYYLVKYYFFDDKYRDPKKGIENLQKSAGQNYVPAQALLGQIYYYGRYGFEKNEQEGLRFYELAAEGGDENAQFEFAGIIKKENPLRAAEFYKKSIKGGYPPAYYGLAMMYVDGLLEDKDYNTTDSYLYKLKEILVQDSTKRFDEYYEKIADAYVEIAFRVDERDTAKWYYSIAVEIYKKLLESGKEFDPRKLIDCYLGISKLYSKIGERSERKKYVALADLVKNEYYDECRKFEANDIEEY